MYKLEDYTNITNTLEMVTPDMAQEWLRRNASSNRKLRPQNVRGIAEDIKHGAWTIDNNNICFDKYGTLIDGQNRLKAIVEAGIAVPCFVRRGLETDSMKTIDGGISRTMNDRSRICGINEDSPAFRSTSIQASVKYIYDNVYGKKGTRLTVNEAETIFNRFSHVFDTVYNMALCTQTKRGAASIRNRYFCIALIAAMCNGVSERRCRAFVDCIARKDIEDAQMLGCDYKVAFKYESDYNRYALNKGGSVMKPYEMANKALYLFSTGKARTTKQTPYAIDENSLEWLERRILVRTEAE